MKHFSTLIQLYLFIVMFTSITSSQAVEKTGFVSDVIGVDEKMLYPAYWKAKIDNGDSQLLSVEEISTQKSELFANNSNMNDLSKFPESLTRAEIINKINSISKKPIKARFMHDGTKVSSSQWQNYKTSLNIKNIPAQKPIKLGLIVRRSNLRTFPTNDRVFKKDNDTNLDRFQETALFPTEIVAILHQSSDEKWLFVSSYNYSAWIEKDNVAIGNREEILVYNNQDKFLVVTGDKIFTTFNPDNTLVSEIQLEMGTRLPLVAADKIPKTLGGQNTYSSYVISLPTRNSQGNLKFSQALVQRNSDVNIGYLPLTRDNIVKQSFKFLGERYGWGHSFNARDCTGFVGEIYKSFGVLMPRNTGQQAKSNQGVSISFDHKTSNKDKLEQIAKLNIGDLIYIPGHVMMVLGFHENQPYVIHDVSGFSYFNEDGKYYESILNGVSVTPLVPLQISQEKSFLDKVYKIKKIL